MSRVRISFRRNPIAMTSTKQIMKEYRWEKILKVRSFPAAGQNSIPATSTVTRMVWITLFFLNRTYSPAKKKSELVKRRAVS